MNRTLLFFALFALAGAAQGHGNDGGNDRDIDKVNGRISAEAGQEYGDLSTVNGSIDLAGSARSRDVETVNGSITAGDDVATRSASTVNGSIHFGERARIDGDVRTVNGGIFIDRGGDLRGDVSTVNGAIGLVDTDLSGDIETVNGDITVGVGSHVKGGIKVEKPTGNWGLRLGKQKVPRIVVGPGAVVEGPLVFEREVKLYVHASARTGAITGASAIPFDTPVPPKD